MPRLWNTLMACFMAAAGLLFSSPSASMERCPALDASMADARRAINQYICFYTARPGETAHGANTPEDLPDNLDWKASRGHDLVFSHTDSVYWIKLTIQNSGAGTNLWFLKLHYPLLDEVTFWQRSDAASGFQQDDLLPLATGDLLPFSTRRIDYRYFLLPVTLEAQEIRSVVIRVHSSGALNVPLELMTPADLIAESNHLTLVHGLFYGALLILAAFNLLLFSSSGTRYYVYNAFYISSMGLFLFAMGGFANQYFWPDSTTLANLSIPLTLIACALSMVLFGWSFLGIARQTLSARALKLLATGAVGALILTFVIPYTQAIVINTLLTLTVIVSLQVIAYARWRQGYQPAFWYLAAWMVMVIGALAYAMAAFGYLGDYQAREVMMQAVVGAQVVLLNYALVQRWRLLNQKLLDMEHQARTGLELKVHERTAQLRNTMRELEQANRKLESLSLNDALTGLYNRRHMDTILPDLCRETHRTAQPLSLALIDADYFKRVNDTWGHDFGDQCLKHIAGILNQHIKRPRDVAIRFGGEEFALLLPGTDAHGTETLCQAILTSVRNQPLTAPDAQHLHLTLSAGIAQLAAGETPVDLFRRADDALYQAKSAGRDRIAAAPGSPAGRQPSMSSTN